MDKKVVTIMVLCVIIAIFITYQSNQKLFGASDSMYKDWTYLVLTFGDGEPVLMIDSNIIQDTLVRYGKSGWEVATQITKTKIDENGYPKTYCYIILKQPLN